jgi:hypothetical protein
MDDVSRRKLFSTGFQSVQRHNIRNLYSTNVSIEHRTMKRKMESQRKRKLPYLMTSYWENNILRVIKYT